MASSSLHLLLLLPLPRFLSPTTTPASLLPPPRSNDLITPSAASVRDHIYQVLELLPDGSTSPKSVSRRQLLKSSGLRLRDLRSVDPSLFLINSSPSLLVRDRALLLNFGSLRAIAMPDRALLFDHHRRSSSAFLRSLLPRLPSPSSTPFELEVIEAALISRIHLLEQRLLTLQPPPTLLPNRLTANVLEDLRLSKQTLVELASRAGALKQMLLDLLDDPHEIRRICLMGRRRTGCVALRRDPAGFECEDAAERQVAEEEEEEIEMLLENYLQRCESCHGQAERLLDSAREMEDSIAVNLSSRRLEVSRVELLLQVGTFCVAVGALVAGIFGMNLRSYLEDHVFAFWLTTAGILLGAAAAFFIMYYYLRARRIL